MTILRFAYATPCLYPAQITLQSTYPQAWMTHYRAENYFAIDPVLRPENFLRGHLPWDDRLFRDTPELWDGARDHGLNKGLPSV